MTFYTDPQSRRRPLHPNLVALGAGFLIAAFATDCLYWQTLLFQWNNFSAWLIVGGLIASFLAGIAFLIDLARRRLHAVSWIRFLALVIAALLSVLNALVHSRDAYTAVVPQGIGLSAVVTLILVAIGLGGWTLDSRRAPGSSTEVRR